MQTEERWVRRMRVFCFGLAMTGMALMGGGCRTMAVITQTAEGVPSADEDGRVQQLNININSQASGRNAEIIARDVNREVEQVLGDRGFRIDVARPDVRVTLKTVAREFDVTGNFYRYEGRIDADAKRVYDQRVLGRETFEMRGDRQLGQEAAIREVSVPLARQTAEWLTGIIHPARSGSASAEVIARFSRFSRRGAQNEFIEMFVDRLTVEPGIVSCRMIGRDRGPREISFRIVYFPDFFPEGLMTRIANMQELNIKTR